MVEDERQHGALERRAADHSPAVVGPISLTMAGMSLKLVVGPEATTAVAASAVKKNVTSEGIFV